MHASFTETRESMVTNADIKDTITKIVSVIESDIIKKKIVEEGKATHRKRNGSG